MGKSLPFTSKSAGRICLFGDHQDYLGLPVIAAAMNKKLAIRVTPQAGNYIDLSMPDLGSSRRIDLAKPFKPYASRDYFLSSLQVAKTHGCVFDGGFSAEIRSEIPINAGASSSSALVVAWINALFELFSNKKPSSLELATFAHAAEVLEHGEPGGRMDHVASAVGGLLYIENSAPNSVQPIKNTPSGFILANSKVPKETLGTLAKNKANALAAIAQMKQFDSNFNLKTRSEDQLQSDLAHLEAELRPAYTAAITNHAITQSAFALLQKSAPISQIAKLMNAHHAQLRDNLKLTVPKIDRLIDCAMQNGALGAKINGSGLGGTVLILAPENSGMICEKLAEMDADAQPISIGSGAEIVYD